MSTTPLPIDQFAKSVRDKYPGAYDDLSDAQLVSKVVAKYPEYKEHIASFAPTQFEQRAEGPDSGGGGGAISAIKRFLPDASSLPNFIASELKAGTSLVPGGDTTTGPEIARRAMRPMPPGSGIGYRAANAASAMVPGLDPESMERRADIGDTAGIYGEAAVPLVAAAAPYLAKGGGAAREAIGGAIHDETGSLKPTARTVAQIGGGLGGAAYGLLEHSPYSAAAGAAAGYKVGPSLMEGLFPEPNSAISARDLFNKAKTITEAQEAAGKENVRRDSASARQARADAKTPDWFSPSHEEIPLGHPDNPGPFSPVSNRLPSSLRGDPFAPAQPVNESAPVVASGEARSQVTGKPSEGRPATWKNEFVKKLAPLGDPDAIDQSILRGFGRPNFEFGPSLESSPRLQGTFEERMAGNVPSSLNVTTDQFGFRWAETPEGRINVPKDIPDADIENFVRQRIQKGKPLAPR